VTREIDPTANEDVRVQHVMKGYRADSYSQIETLVFMAFFERAHAVFCRNLQGQATEPVLADLIGRIAIDEERHEEFFANLVTHLLQTHRDETIAAIAARAGELGVVGADIEAYQDKIALMAESGIFGPDTLARVIADRITAWGLAEEAELQKFIGA
jgi:acyl-[acyl-carrier-protein] desaturase